MASTTISISQEAHQLLKRFRAEGESFSDVIVEHFSRRRLPAMTGGELLARLESQPPPQMDENRLKALRAGRGRKSNRPQK